MKQLLIVFVGGGTGSVLRFIIGKYLNNLHSIPFGTFLVNIIGCFLIGLFLGSTSKNNWLSLEMTLLLATGFCGGFTTFSSFIYESQVIWKSGELINFFLYTIFSFLFGFFLLFLGIWITK